MLGTNSDQKHSPLMSRLIPSQAIWETPDVTMAKQNQLCGCDTICATSGSRGQQSVASQNAALYCGVARHSARRRSPRRLCAPAAPGRPHPETAPPMCLPAHRPAGRARAASQRSAEMQHHGISGELLRRSYAPMPVAQLRTLQRLGQRAGAADDF